MTVFNYSASGILYSGITYKNTFFSSTKPTFDAGISADASISSFDKVVPTLDFSNSKNNSSSSVPTTFDSGAVLPVTFDLQDQRSLSSANKNASYSVNGSGSITISSAKIENNTESYLSSGKVVLGKIIFAYSSSSEILVNTTLLRVNELDALGNISAIQKISVVSGVTSGSLHISSAKVESNTESYVGSGTVVPAKSILPNETFDNTGTKFDDDTNKSPVFATFDKNYLAFTQFNPVTLLPLTYDSGVTSPHTFDKNDSQIIPNFGKVSISYAKYSGSGSVTLSGVRVEKNTESYSGTGTLRLSGNLTHPNIDFTPHYGRESNIGVGTYAFSISGVGSVSHPYQTPENTQLFKIGVQSIVPSERRFDETRSAFDIDGNTLPTYASFDKDYLNFAKFNVATVSPLTFDNNLYNPDFISVTETQFIPSRALESFITNPPENVELFSISGTITEKHTESYLGVGTVTFSGPYSNFKFRNSYNGSGSIVLSGVEVEKNTESYVGSGIITSGRSYIPPVPLVQTFDQTQPVFDIDGNALPTYVSFDKDYINFAKFNVDTVSPLTFDNTLRNPASVNAQLQSIPNYGLESFVVNPPENVELFSVSGSLVEKNTESYVGSGSIVLSGVEVEKNTESYVGSGTVTFSGTGIEKNTESYVGVGTVTFSGSYSNFKFRNSYNGSGSIVLSGVELEKNTESYVGSGLITVSGIVNESFGLTTYNGSGSIVLSGVEVEKNTESYVGSGIITSGTSYILPTVRTFDQTQAVFDIDGNKLPTYVSFDKDYINFAKFNVATVSPLTFDNTLRNPDSIGSQLQSLPNYALESFVANPPENVELFNISGSYSDLKFRNSYLASGSITISAAETEKYVRPYIGSGSITLSGTRVERNTESYVGSGSIVLSGVEVEKNTESYVGSGSITLSGTRVERNTESYVGSGSINVSSSLNESYTRRGYQGSGSIQLYSSKLESRAIVPLGLSVVSIVISGKPLVHPDVRIIPAETGSGQVTIYGSTFPPAVSSYRGSGTVILSGKANTFALLPIGASGGFLVYGSVNPSFTRQRYIGLGRAIFSGRSSSRKISLYTGVGRGTINLSSTSKERNTEAYFGSGSITLSGVRVEKNRENYVGLGSITISGSIVEKVVETPKPLINPVIISGTGKESFTRQRYLGIGTATFSGKDVTSRLFKSERGSGIITISSVASVAKKSVFTYSGSGDLRFLVHVSNQDYDTCDSLVITSDYQDSARFAFIANPPENVQLFNVSGSAATRRTLAFTYSGSGTVGISGFISIRKTNSVFGFGSITLGSTGGRKKIHSYNGTGNINVSSASAKSLVKKSTSSTSLFTVSGSARTGVNRLFRTSGIGTQYFSSSSAETRKLSRPSFSGIGTISISGQLVYPDIKFIPAPKGRGTINIIGSSNNKLIRRYSQTSGVLFAISNSKESYTRSTYVGVGTIYVQSTSGITVNNPYQIPRTYVWII
jgi:hypothetical protein